MTDLTALLHATFGFPAFRPNQQAVCRVVTDGRDALLVMPTGAGKSLCYQLPAIARGGTALVVSPLIALMDDQAAKLTAHSLRVGRIHSGLTRDDARQVCREYLDGALNFLFIAPERMRVPGFPEMLARRKPSLIAIDEAHCISAWGHDFRPDYRTLGEHLPALRPAPILALTATATPMVQQDIVAQLHLNDTALFIHGFRRTNLAIEVVEMSKPRRPEFTVKLLQDPAARPAIVYTPSRRDAEELAAQLALHFPAAAYHAGLVSSVRERVQRGFQSGKLEVVVATIAFGMGIDKANVRTIVHTALPASVEAFYQEIGRAGRDGLPSRSVLLHSYADRKMHEFFLDRDYPPAEDLVRVAAVLADEFLMPGPLAQRLKMDLDTFSKAIEKLVAQGAAAIDLAGNVRRTGPISKSGAWRAAYDAQIAFRRSQLDRMATFAETQQCRMTALIRHFGDTADAHRPCGLCDFCSPATTTAQTFRPPTPEELRQLAHVLRELQGSPGQSRSTGKLYTSLADGPLRATSAAKDRKLFDTLLDALARAALITLASDTFTNPEGNVINYKKAALTHEGRQAAATADFLAYDLRLPDIPIAASSTSKSKKSLATKPSKASRQTEREQTTAAFTPAQKQLDEYLRAWRTSEAAKTGKPAFIVLSDAVIRNLVFACPRSVPELLTVSGIGPEKADRFGAAIVALCRTGGATNPANAIASSGAVTSHHTVLTKGPKAHNIPAQGKALGKHTERTTSAEGATYTRPTPTFHRTRTTAPSDPAAVLTPGQQLLDASLREWRKSESERIGLPQFFVLGSSTLRSIVLLRPRTVAQLQSITGIGPDKAEKFGPAIVALCNA